MILILTTQGGYYQIEYEDTTINCPNCGKESVWVERDPGDYYCGSQHLCITCCQAFTIQLDDASSYTDFLIKQLREKNGVKEHD